MKSFIYFFFFQSGYLPDSYSYDFVHFNRDSSVTFRVGVQSKEELDMWLSLFKKNISWVTRRKRARSIHLFEVCDLVYFTLGGDADKKSTGLHNSLKHAAAF